MAPDQIDIAFVSPYDHARAISGARKRVENLAKAYCALGLRVACFSPWRPDADLAHTQVSLDGGLKSKLVGMKALREGLIRMRPRMVISEVPLPFAIKQPWCHVHVIHDAKFVTRHRRGNGLGTFWGHYLTARMADHVVTVSHSEKERLARALRLPEGKFVVSYNGLDARWHEAPPQGIERLFDVLYVSNFAKHKGHERLIQAIRGTGITIAFVGADFGERERCRSLAAQDGVCATFLENLTEDDLIAVYDRSSVFAFPSLLEGFGLPFLEARARGLPVLAQDIPVFRELAGLAGGELADFGNEAEVREGLSRLLSVERVGVELDGHSWRNIAERLLIDCHFRRQPM
jgi:glycosyltransferase involved in cell wall biosynthesis